MSLVKELQRLVQSSTHVSGRVVSVSGTKVLVATASGQMEVSANGDLFVGDLVTVNSSRATKKQRSGHVSIFTV
jgi:hypothetical protein